MNKRVRTGSFCYYLGTGIDRCDRRITLKEGDYVRVIQPPGCPKNGTMGQCYVESPSFWGMVCCNSLHTKEEWKEYLQSKGEKNEVAN